MLGLICAYDVMYCMYRVQIMSNLPFCPYVSCPQLDSSRRETTQRCWDLDGGGAVSSQHAVTDNVQISPFFGFFRLFSIHLKYHMTKKTVVRDEKCTVGRTSPNDFMVMRTGDATQQLRTFLSLFHLRSHAEPSTLFKSTDCV